MNQCVVYQRTPKGLNELRTRMHGLSPRAHQLLLLVDGARSTGELQRIFPRHELSAYLAVLKSAAFIVASGQQAGPAHCASTEPAGDELEQLRDHALYQLLVTIGPAAEPFALRLAKCKTRAELESLVPAMQSIVEVSRGPMIAKRFAREVMPV